MSIHEVNCNRVVPLKNIFIKYCLPFLLFCLIVSNIVLAGCSSTKIGDILDNSSQYEGEELSLSGTIGETLWFSLLEKGAYQIGDGTGNIWVITSQPPPQQGGHGAPGQGRRAAGAGEGFALPPGGSGDRPRQQNHRLRLSVAGTVDSFGAHRHLLDTRNRLPR